MSTTEVAAPTCRLMEGSEAIARGRDRRGLPVLRRLPDDAVHRAARALRQAPARGGRRVHQRRERARGGRHGVGRARRPARAPRPAPPARACRSCRSRSREITLAELPLVIFNMARGQQDYYQSTRGGGHGDYRHIVLAPDGHRRGGRAHAARVPPRRQVAQPRARLRRLPPRAHPEVGATSSRSTFAHAPGEGLGGRRLARRQSGRSRHRLAARLRQARPRAARASSATCARSPTSTPRWSGPRCGSRPAFTDDAETVVVAFGSPGKFVRYVVQQLRAEGEKIGYVRPITLWPFPYDAVARRGRGRDDASACSSCARAR